MGELILFVESDLPSGRSAGVPSFFFWNLIKRRKLRSFSKFSFFSFFGMFLASGRQKRFFYFIRTGDKEHRNQNVFLNFVKLLQVPHHGGSRLP